MSFLAPLGLLALLTLPLIVLLHLMRERRRRVVVPSLLLWQLMPRRQEAQRRRRLPLTLLLLLHLLAAALLALALARPQWPLDLFGGEEHLALIIDTSTSMDAPAPGVGAGSRLEAARARANALIGSLAGRDSVTLISAGPQAALLDRGGAQAAARLAAALDGLSAGGTGSDMRGAMTLAEAALRGRDNARIVVITDAALPTLADDLDQQRPALPVAWELVGDALDNRAVVTLAARPRGANGSVQIYARAVNYGTTPLRTSLRLYGDDELIDTRAVSFLPNGEVELTWSLPFGVGLLRAELDGADALPADDQAALNLLSARPIRALLVSAQPDALQRALGAVPGLTIATLDPLAYPGAPVAAEADLTVFDGYLPETWPAGAVLAINPPPGGTLLTVGARPREAEATAALSLDAAGTATFEGVSLGSLAFGPVVEINSPDWAAAWLSRGDQPLILRGRSGQSEIAIWAFDLAQGNLTGRLAFPLLVARTVRDLAPVPLPGSALLGESIVLRPDPRADSVELIAPDGLTERFVLASGETMRVNLAQPGIYQIFERQGEETLFASNLPVNAGSPIESALAPRPLPAPVPVPVAGEATAESAERPLWPWLAALALFVVMVEWLYVHGARRPGVMG